MEISRRRSSEDVGVRILVRARSMAVRMVASTAGLGLAFHGVESRGIREMSTKGDTYL